MATFKVQVSRGVDLSVALDYLQNIVDTKTIRVYTLIMSSEEKVTISECQQVARQCACFNLRKATRAVTQLYDEVLRETGIRVTQLTLLVAAYLSGEIPISQMAEVLVMDRTTLTRNLKPLQIQGLIAVHSGADRREKLVTLTARGHTMVSKALPLWEQAQRRIIEGLGKDRFDSMLRDLSKAVSLAHT